MQFVIIWPSETCIILCLFKKTKNFLKQKKKSVTSHFDDTTTFSNGTNVLTILNNTENKASKVFDWFWKIYLKGNPDLWDLLLTSKEETSIKIEGYIIKRSPSQKLFCVIIDKKLNLQRMFQNYGNKQFKKSMLLHEF